MEKKRWVFLLHLFFHLVRIQSGSNSSFSSKSNPSDQQEQDKIVEFLPGQDFNVSFAHYSGYIKVNEEEGRTLFYWFIEAVEDPSSKPLLLWLNGGPGCSSIGSGEAEEIGPFHVNSDGKTISLNPYSWNQVGNILFIDSPVGTGFSYSNNPSDLETNGDKRTADDSLVFLLKWFDRFPQYKGRDFYLVGESYAGHYIPQLAQAIMRYHKMTQERSINLKGYMVGNPLTDDFYDHLGGYKFLWTAGLISDQTYKLLNLYCDHVSYVHSSHECDKISDIASFELGNIDIYSIFTPSCTNNGSHSNRRSKGLFNGKRINEKYDPCGGEHSTVYFNFPEVQKALHVNLETAPSKWEICSDVIFKTWTDTSPVLDIYRELINYGLRIWIFSGDTDTVIPITSTRYSIHALNLPITSPWRAWYDEGQVGGWTEEYVGLTFVSIRGGGHMVSLVKPKLALVLVKSFLLGGSMPSLSGFHDS